MSESLAIAVCNRKGGVGKTTVSTHLATLFAARGWKTALLDCDFQQSASEWAKRRGSDHATVEENPKVIDAHGSRSMLAPALRFRIPALSECLIYDAPVCGRSADIAELLRRVQLVIVPVLPSAGDMEVSGRFIEELLKTRDAQTGRLKIAVIANRVRHQQRSSRALAAHIADWNAPLIGTLRDTQLYVFAAGFGITIHELKSARAQPDRDEWGRIYDAIFRVVGARSLPAASVRPVAVASGQS